MKRRTTIAVRICAALLVGIASIAHADEGPLHDRFTLDFGAYFMSSDTTIRVDDVDGFELGTTFHLEDTFEFGDDSVFRFEGQWRFLPRHKLSLMYFSSKRTRSNQLDRDIEFGDASFEALATVRAEFDFEIAELAYEYMFVRRDGFEVGASIGVHNASFKVALSASSSLAGQGVSGSFQDRASADAPLPVFGLRGLWRLGASNFYLQGHAQYFQVEFGDYKGNLKDLQAGVLWQFSRHVGVGAAYNLFDTEVDVDDPGQYRGELDWQYDGAQVFVRAAF